MGRSSTRQARFHAEARQPDACSMAQPQARTRMLRHLPGQDMAKTDRQRAPRHAEQRDQQRHRRERRRTTGMRRVDEKRKERHVEHDAFRIRHDRQKTVPEQAPGLPMSSGHARPGPRHATPRRGACACACACAAAGSCRSRSGRPHRDIARHGTAAGGLAAVWPRRPPPARSAPGLRAAGRRGNEKPPRGSASPTRHWEGNGTRPRQGQEHPHVGDESPRFVDAHPVHRDTVRVGRPTAWPLRGGIASASGMHGAASDGFANGKAAFR